MVVTDRAGCCSTSLHNPHTINDGLSSEQVRHVAAYSKNTLISRGRGSEETSVAIRFAQFSLEISMGVSRRGLCDCRT